MINSTQKRVWLVAAAALAGGLAIFIMMPAPKPTVPAAQKTNITVSTNQEVNTNETTANVNQAVPATVAEEVFPPAKVALTEEDVAYFGDVKGLYVHPTNGGPYPGVVVTHEWWGLNDSIREAARRLAGQGYAVLAVDLYEGKVATTQEEALALVGTVSKDEPHALQNMAAAVNYVRSHGAPRIAMLGWCFGGGQVLQFSLTEPVDATVIYYGTPLVTDEKRLAAIDWPVLGVFGDADEAIPVEQAKSFGAALDKVGVKNEILIYPGVGHAFANPSGPNYKPDETRDAWVKTLAFLEKNLR